MTLTPSDSPALSPSATALRDLRAASCGPVGAPSVTSDLSENVILTSLDDLHNWARLSSLWPLLYGTACCFIEFAALIGSRFDFDRFGLVPRSSPRQADLLIVAGTVTMKMAPALVRLYEQMPEPKYVIAMGACTITGGMFSADSTTAVRGVDKLIPVDLYLPGCPPRPEAIFDAVIKLRKKVGNEALAERGRLQQTHRYCTIPHQFSSVEPIVDGRYLRAETQMAALAAATAQPLSVPVAAAEPINAELIAGSSSAPPSPSPSPATDA
jgi:NAD(P)H-quinone oxidoreductase subunit K